ncbi:MAG: hypothetical protein K9M57_02085 [Phycisphaerae bacterium]|nr:hypothetical protein [Phycisphaerae bacterium]
MYHGFLGGGGMNLGALGKIFFGASTATKTTVVVVGLVALEVGTISVVKIANDKPLTALGIEVPTNPETAAPVTSIPGQGSLSVPVAGGAEGVDGTASDSGRSTLQAETVDEGAETVAEESTSSGDGTGDTEIMITETPPASPSQVLVPERLVDLSVISPPD